MKHLVEVYEQSEVRDLYKVVEHCLGDALMVQKQIRQSGDDVRSLLPEMLKLYHLRLRAKDKFSRAHELFFTQRGYEQATSERVAHFKSLLFHQMKKPLFLCSGIGAEVLSWAVRPTVEQIMCVDSDPEMAEILMANARVYGVEGKITMKINTVEEFLQTASLDQFDGIIIDPDRRDTQGRSTSYLRMSPDYEALFPLLFDLQVPILLKLSPALPQDELRTLREHWALMTIQEEKVLKEILCIFDPLQNTYPKDSLHAVLLGAKETTKATILQPSPTEMWSLLPPDDVAQDLVGYLDQIRFLYPLPGAWTRLSGQYQVAKEMGGVVLDRDSTVVGCFSEPQHYLYPDYPLYRIIHGIPFSKKTLQVLVSGHHISHGELHFAQVPFGPAEIKKILPRFPEYGPEALFFASVRGTTCVFYTQRVL